MDKERCRIRQGRQLVLHGFIVIDFHTLIIPRKPTVCQILQSASRNFFQNMILSIEQNINFGYQLMGINKTINSTSDNQSVIEEMMRSSGAIPMFLSAVVIGPICEELVFRKAIFDVFKKPEIAIIVSSIAFGLIHIISSIGISTPLELCLMTIPYVSSGIAFGYIYIRFKQNIWIPIIAHTLSNFISMIGIIFLI